MVNFTLLAGGYSQFINTYVFDDSTSSLSLVGQSQTGGNPSWIALHPTNSSILYSVNENSPGGLQSFIIQGDGLLSGAVNTIATQGDSPAFTTPLSTGQVAVMNYGSGNGLIIPTTEDPLVFDESAITPISFPAAVSHPHMAIEDGAEVLVPDLGADKVWRLVQNSPDTPGQWSIEGDIVQPTGSGPRHGALSDGFLYVVHELASTLTSQLLPSAPNGTSDIISDVSVVPTDPAPPVGAAMAAGEILIPTTSDTFTGSYVFTSNRNTGTLPADGSGDAIAIFTRNSDGSVTHKADVFTGLDQIRGMQFFGDEDRYLVASGVEGTAGVRVYERQGDGGDLKFITENDEVPTRTSFVWVKDL